MVAKRFERKVSRQQTEVKDPSSMADIQDFWRKVYNSLIEESRSSERITCKEEHMKKIPEQMWSRTAKKYV